MTMPFLLLSLAAEVLNLDDIGATKRRARTLLDGPDRCIEVQAEAKVTVVILGSGGLFGSPTQSVHTASGSLFGRLDHGVWKSWGPPLQDDHPDDQVTLGAITAHPMVGKTVEHEGDPEHSGSMSVSGSGDVALANSGPKAVNLLDEILDEVDPQVTMAYVEPDAGGWALVEHADIAGQEEDLDMRWHIEASGLPTALDVTFPKRMRLGDGLVAAKVLNGQLHLAGMTNELGTLPTIESLSVVVGVLGFTVGVEQEIRYARVRPCP